MTSSQDSIYQGLIADSFRLNGQVALVAGGYGGIGAALCLGLAQQGASVVIAGRSAEKSAALAGHLASGGFTALGLSFDIKEPDEISELGRTERQGVWAARYPRQLRRHTHRKAGRRADG